MARAWPEGTAAQIRALFEAGEVRVDGVIVTRPERPVASQVMMTARADEEGAEVFGLPDVEVLLWGEEWVVVDKPVGIPGRISGDDPMHPVRFMADLLGIDRQGVAPVWEMPAAAGGPWLVAKQPDVATQLAKSICSGEINTTWLALTRRPTHAQGHWKTERGELHYAITRSEDEFAELQLTPRWQMDDARVDQLFVEILAMAAEAGFPVLGDTRHGGYLVAGDVRLRLGAIYGGEDFAHSWPAPRQWWPEEPVVEPVVADKGLEEGADQPPLQQEIRRLLISSSAAERVRDLGHPWVLRDGYTESASSMRPGDPVQLVGPSGPLEIFALIDGTASIAARVWSRDRQQAEAYREELEIRLDEAIGRRRSFFRDMGSTDVFRIVHGEADGLPGLSIDLMGGLWSVTTTGRCARGYRGAVYELLQQRDPAAMIIESENLGAAGNLRDAVPARLVTRGAGILEMGEALVVRDQGLRHRIDPWDSDATMIFAAQRDNRRRAATLAESGQRWLDLSPAHHGFTLSLANSGAEVTRINESEKDRNRLQESLQLNQLSPDLVDYRDDQLAEIIAAGTLVFDGIILDLDGCSEKTIAHCLQMGANGASMAIFRRTDRSNASLESVIRRAAAIDERDKGQLRRSYPPADFPRIEAFPEGDPLEAVWIDGGANSEVLRSD